jgi:hypothetical protein
MTESTQNKLLFDEKANNIMRAAATQSLASIPELRSVVVVYDYHDKLNSVDGLSKGIWLSEGGSNPRSPDAIVGTLGSTLQAAAHMIDELFQCRDNLQKEVTALSQQKLELLLERQADGRDRQNDAGVIGG